MTRAPSPRFFVASLIAAACFSIASGAAATERHFTYTYESGVLSPGHVELEPWTTFRVGREDFYSRIDNRIEFELGLTERLQTSLYFNTSAIAQDVVDIDGTKFRQSSFELTSISSEWKLALTDPVADALGSALYFEGTYGNTEAEIEGKLILDRRIDDLVLAANLVGELEWEFAEPDETEEEAAFELDLGAAYFITPHVTLGVEVRPIAAIEEGEVESVALFAGPTLSFTSDGYWTALSVLPQVYSPKNEENEPLDLEHNERLQARVLLGMQL